MALHKTSLDRKRRLSRRTVLSLGATGALTAIAGCAQLSSDDSADDRPAPEPADAIDGVEVRTFWYEQTGEIVTTGEDPVPVGRQYIISESDVAALTFTDEPIDGGDPREFLQSLEYAEETALVLVDEVDACHRESLQYVEERSGGGLSVQFCRTYRDPDVECSTDDQQTQLTLIAVPISFDSEPSGFSRGGSSRCQVQPDHPKAGDDE